MSQQEMVKVATWVLCLCDENTNEPKFYFNNTDNVFQVNFTNQCAFLDEKSCSVQLKKLNLEGVEMVEGTMDYPKNVLTNIIVDTFKEYGLI